MEAARQPWPTLGVLLVRDGLVTSDQLEEVLAQQGDERENRISSRRLGEALVERGLATSGEIARRVAEQHELPFVDLEDPDARVRLDGRLPEEVAHRYSALPIRLFPDGSVLVVVSDPTRSGCFDEIRRAVGMPVRFAVAAPDLIEAAIAEDAPEPTIPDEGETAPAPSERPWPVLGSLLLRDGLVTEDELDAALAQQRLSSTRRLGEILVARGALGEEAISRALAEQHEVRFVDLREHELDPAVASLLPLELARSHAALPIQRLADGSLLVVVADPTTALHSEELQSALDEPLEFAVGMLAEIQSAIEELEAGSDERPPAPTEPDSPALAVAPDRETETDGQEPLPEPPADPEHAEALDALERALEGGASAVHFVPRPNGIVVLARIDGVAGELETIPSEHADAIRHELAELARGPRLGLDLAERSVEVRPAVVPTLFGDRVTFRVVDAPLPTPFAELLRRTGSAEALLGELERGLGLVAFCGPAASVRGSTLHAALAEVVAKDRVVLAIEESVDHVVTGVEHVETDLGRGLTYAAGLETILRSDPDVVVVGELADPPTARLATRAALDGRLVLTTVEASSAVEGVQRLLELGVAPSALARALSAVVGQRSVRSICLDCRESYYASRRELADLGRHSGELGRRLLGRGRGCGTCGGTGFGADVELFESLPLTDAVRVLIEAGASVRELAEGARDGGMRTLLIDAAELCLDGVTTAADVGRLARHGTA